MRVLVLARNYPNDVTPLLGVWTGEMVRHVARHCEVRVISPVPYFPPLPGPAAYTRFRQVARRETRHGVEVRHPRFMAGPGYLLHDFEARAYLLAIRRQVARLRREFPFDLIHAHYGYPDGCVAAALGRAYGVPIMITEHAPWHPWMEQYPRVRAQAVRAARESAFHITVSRYARETVARFTGDTPRLRIIPNGVDTEVFTPPVDGRPRPANQLLYVGIMRHVKGVDVLLRAMHRLVGGRPDLRLVMVGGGFYPSHRRQEERYRDQARALGLGGNVEFVGMKSLSEVAAYMRASTALILPSRSETFGSVLIEALACGTPVVATRCGGPEDVVNERVGRLVAKEDPGALAGAVADVVARRDDYDPAYLRQYAVENFAWDRVARRTVELYGEAVAGGRGAGR